jgi:dsDNA-binding SOS-regulon protein
LHEAQQQVLLLQEKVVKMMDQCQESLDLLMAEKDEKAKLRMKLQQLQAENSI